MTTKPKSKKPETQPHRIHLNPLLWERAVMEAERRNKGAGATPSPDGKPWAPKAIIEEVLQEHLPFHPESVEGIRARLKPGDPPVIFDSGKW